MASIDLSNSFSINFVFYFLQKPRYRFIWIPAKVKKSPILCATAQNGKILSHVAHRMPGNLFYSNKIELYLFYSSRESLRLRCNRLTAEVAISLSVNNGTGNHDVWIFF